MHVYLTYPFVLSWSFVEAMASGCLIVASATAPVLEVKHNGENGLTVDFFTYRKLADRIEAALDAPEKRQALRSAARSSAVAQFDLQRVVLPRWRALFEDLVGGACRRSRVPRHVSPRWPWPTSAPVYTVATIVKFS